MSKREDKIFCVECGAKNEVGTKRCVKCHKNPDPKDHAFKDYLWKKAQDKGQDEGIKMLTRFLKKHLYGVLMSGSILFTGAAIIANTVFADNHIEMVTERPTIKYLGEGLDAEAVLRKYVDAIRNGDLTTVYGLQLEKTRPDVYEEIKDVVDNSSPGFGEKKLIKVHTLVKFADVYFRDGRGYQVSDYVDEVNDGAYKDYSYRRYNVSVIFCEDNICDNDNDFNSMLWLTDQVEVVEVDGNYYVSGEKHHYEQMNESDVIIRGLIYNAHGDMTKVHLADVYGVSLCGDSEDCMRKYGGMEVPQEW